MRLRSVCGVAVALDRRRGVLRGEAPARRCARAHTHTPCICDNTHLKPRQICRAIATAKTTPQTRQKPHWTRWRLKTRQLARQNQRRALTAPSHSLSAARGLAVTSVALYPSLYQRSLSLSARAQPPTCFPICAKTQIVRVRGEGRCCALDRPAHRRIAGS